MDVSNFQLEFARRKYPKYDNLNILRTSTSAYLQLFTCTQHRWTVCVGIHVSEISHGKHINHHLHYAIVLPRFSQILVEIGD
jgi:hypothetical protein